MQGSWSYDAGAGVVNIELRQVQEGDPFVMSLDVGVYADGDARPSHVTTVEVHQTYHRFEIPVAGEPGDVRLDPDTRTLFRAEFGRRD